MARKGVKGVYIVFEGIVGVGKTAHSRLLAQRLGREFPKREVIWTREPGGTEVAGAIRKIVQATDFEFGEEIEPICEAYLYAASRAHSLRRVVEPILKKGGIVISDRSFLTSVAFQGAGRGLGCEAVLAINEAAVNDITPDLVVYLDVNPAVSLKRTRDVLGDKFERMELDFYRKARKGYAFASKKFKRVWFEVDGTASIEENHDKIYRRVLKLL